MSMPTSKTAICRSRIGSCCRAARELLVASNPYRHSTAQRGATRGDAVFDGIGPDARVRFDELHQSCSWLFLHDRRFHCLERRRVDRGLFVRAHHRRPGNRHCRPGAGTRAAAVSLSKEPFAAGAHHFRPDPCTQRARPNRLGRLSGRFAVSLLSFRLGRGIAGRSLPGIPPCHSGRGPRRRAGSLPDHHPNSSWDVGARRCERPRHCKRHGRQRPIGLLVAVRFRSRAGGTRRHHGRADPHRSGWHGRADPDPISRRDCNRWHRFCAWRFHRGIVCGNR